MFYYLLQRPYRWPFVILILSIPLFNWIDRIIELMLTSSTNIAFTYAEPAHLKLIYLVLGVVFVGLSSAIHRSENQDQGLIEKNLLKWVITMIISFIVGNLIHLWMLYDILDSKGSLMNFEQNIWLYFLADYFLVFCFAVGGFVWVKPIIHQN